MEGACDSNCIFCNYVDGFVDVLMPSVWKWNMFHNNILLVTQRFTVDTGLRWATKMWLSTRTGIQALSTRLLSSRAGGKKTPFDGGWARAATLYSSQALNRTASERACVRVAVTGTALSRRTEPNHLVDSGLDTSAAEPSLYVNSERIRAEKRCPCPCHLGQGMY